MNAEGDSISIVVGPEYSERHRSALGTVMRREGAVRQEEKMFIAGSQLVEIYTFLIDGEEVVVESETFMGLSIRGPEQLVRSLAQKVIQEADELPDDNGEC